jgi:hypothetical protein
VASRLSRALGALALAAAIGCASVGARYEEGQRAFAEGRWQAAIDALEFYRVRCGRNDRRCAEVSITIAESRLRLGNPKQAFFDLEVAREITHLDRDSSERLQRLQDQAAEAAFPKGIQQSPEHGTLSVRFRNEPRERLALGVVRFFLDLQPLQTSRARYVEGTTVLAVAPTQISAGHHELVVFVTLYGSGRLFGYTFTTQAQRSVEILPNQAADLEVRLANGHTEKLMDSFKIEFVPPK